MKIIEGGVCAIDNILAGGHKKGKYGLGIIYTGKSTAATVFTSNKIKAEPLKLTMKNLEDGRISAIIANSGNANCFTGPKGMEDAQRMAKLAADGLSIPENGVAVASTGVIGRKMPMNIIETLTQKVLKNLENSPRGSRKFAEAIMTTDTFPKEFAVEFELDDGNTARIGGVAKGSGMIAPNMATMLSFITTDVKASPSQLKEALKKAVDESFNMLIIDGDESTNDMVILAATGKSGKIDDNFQEALNLVCRELAKMIAKDGEGATKYMEVEVLNAKSKKDARKAAKTVASSPLVKTALFGADPNWGRIIAAIGYSGAMIKEENVSIILESENRNIELIKEGKIIASENSKELKIAADIMREDEIKIIIDLGIGKEKAKAYGCDLTYDYVKINAEYTT
ncbi:MAG TPA: bifunctional ornithine acetyltransferase/N-acetylglutamate synthase [Methanothermobacter sp.]|nr:arginine biosynthesis bifunctional protein ArgJ [Methanothermobacter sp. MT-2]HHW05640.1 bifunctional ornithine acetyltransferase/N-acetylglutamate synthase [Methanothermobacter sp.]HOK72740.1 bifunctional ornithine acetyltransferase/N-acetylglutamate synthase [Methanothermobacter sp.]HOL68540.1 bifunctional ornithine acetyltransferase/N-acetylglutamate synthase [Methanothermobacter sp.]HPQ04299.1 bifunctional ornithine acetyltransferase/N-acetylglutamate synthase [Methanothermobacter sp.]